MGNGWVCFVVFYEGVSVSFQATETLFINDFMATKVTNNNL